MIEPLHSPAETAKILGISIKTLRGHVELGRIRSIIVGSGKKRKHRMFTDKNIRSFIESQKLREVPQCQSSSTPKAPTIKLSSISTVIPFEALPKPATKKKQRP